MPVHRGADANTQTLIGSAVGNGGHLGGSSNHLPLPSIGEVANLSEINAIPVGNGQVPVLGEVIVAALLFHWGRQGRLGGVAGHVIETYRQDFPAGSFGLNPIFLLNVPQGIEARPPGNGRG